MTKTGIVEEIINDLLLLNTRDFVLGTQMAHSGKVQGVPPILHTLSAVCLHHAHLEHDPYAYNFHEAFCEMIFESENTP